MRLSKLLYTALASAVLYIVPNAIQYNAHAQGAHDPAISSKITQPSVFAITHDLYRYKLLDTMQRADCIGCHSAQGLASDSALTFSTNAKIPVGLMTTELIKDQIDDLRIYVKSEGGGKLLESFIDPHTFLDQSQDFDNSARVFVTLLKM